MKLFSDSTTLTTKIITLFLFAFLALIMSMHYADWPQVLQGWEGDTHRFERIFRFGIAGSGILLVLVIWLIIQPFHFHEIRNYPSKYFGLLFILFFGPLSQFLILAFTSDGFKLNPAGSHPRMIQFENWMNIQFYFFMGVVIGYLIYLVKNKKLPGMNESPTPLHPS